MEAFTSYEGRRTRLMGSMGDTALLTSTIDAPIESHVMGIAAEKSRKENKVVEIKM
ncbi:MAG: hypothetical protein WBC06_08825 [Chitinophagaceae bacterium]